MSSVNDCPRRHPRRVHTEEVTGSNPVSPTLFQMPYRQAARQTRDIVNGQCLSRSAPSRSRRQGTTRRDCWRAKSVATGRWSPGLRPTSWTRSQRPASPAQPPRRRGIAVQAADSQGQHRRQGESWYRLTLAPWTTSTQSVGVRSDSRIAEARQDMPVGTLLRPSWPPRLRRGTRRTSCPPSPRTASAVARCAAALANIALMARPATGDPRPARNESSLACGVPVDQAASGEDAGPERQQADDRHESWAGRPPHRQHHHAGTLRRSANSDPAPGSKKAKKRRRRAG